MSVSVERVRRRRVYEKPVFEKQEELIFLKEVIEQLNGGRLCVQCSSIMGFGDVLERRKTTTLSFFWEKSSVPAT